jgi:hypothetical protein
LIGCAINYVAPRPGSTGASLCEDSALRRSLGFPVGHGLGWRSCANPSKGPYRIDALSILVSAIVFFASVGQFSVKGARTAQNFADRRVLRGTE